MKKKIFTLLICFLCLVTVFSGCGLGTYVTNNKNKDPSGTTKPENPGNPGNHPVDNYDYIVSVYYGKKLFDPGENDITVVWRNSEEIIRVRLGADGKANAGELEGDYSVYLEGLPTKYTYNPGAYVATEEERQITLLLTDIRKPERGDGKGLYVSEGCYVVKFDGTYRAEISKEGQRVYYEYTPTAGGWYKIESWVNVYEDVVDPYIIRYSGSSAFKYDPQTIEDGGFQLNGGFTKNFRYDVQIDKNEVGNAFTIAVMAVSKFSEYPVYVDFAISYVGEYSSSYSDVRTIRAKAATTKAAEREKDETYTWADMNTRNFDMSNYKYNEGTGFYHRYSEELYADNSYGYGAGYGPILLCSIKNKLPSYDIYDSTTTLYNAHNVSTERGPVNFLLLTNIWVEEEKKYVTYDYQEFIRTDYGGKCNSEGYCYVTPELKDFLQTFAEQKGLWTDGIDDFNTNTPEAKGYYAQVEAFWLFACGFYTK